MNQAAHTQHRALQNLHRFPMHCAHLKAGVVNYLQNGIEPGSALSCILSNDLCGAVWHGDMDVRRSLPQIVVWLREYFPSEAWGGERQMRDWIKVGGLKGLETGT